MSGWTGRRQPATTPHTILIALILCFYVAEGIGQICLAGSKDRENEAMCFMYLSRLHTSLVYRRIFDRWTHRR